MRISPQYVDGLELRIKELESQLGAATNRWNIAMKLLNEIGANNRFYAERANTLLNDVAEKQ